MKANRTLTFVLTAIMMAVSMCVQARTYLVSVGVADYSGYPSSINNLSLTTNDARTIADLYSKNTPVDYALLLDSKATKSRILRAIKKLFSRAKEDDIVVFFFSGHGFPGGFCAYDGNVSYGEIRKAMAQSRCKNKMMFVDACRAGGMRVDNHQAQGALTAAKNANVMLFLSSRNNENSMERGDMNNGFFTHYLNSGLRGKADANGNHVITAKELFDYVHSGVAKISSNKQHPVMWGNFNNNMIVMQW